MTTDTPLEQSLMQADTDCSDRTGSGVLSATATASCFSVQPRHLPLRPRRKSGQIIIISMKKMGLSHFCRENRAKLSSFLWGK